MRDQADHGNVARAAAVTVASDSGPDRPLSDVLADLGGGAPVEWEAITGRPDAYPPATHTHPASALASGTVAVARLPTGTTGSTVALGNHTHAGLLTGAPEAVPDTDAATVADVADALNGLLAALRARGVIT